jgi:hypothetical protein
MEKYIVDCYAINQSGGEPSHVGYFELYAPEVPQIGDNVKVPDPAYTLHVTQRTWDYPKSDSNSGHVRILGKRVYNRPASMAGLL